ncbi:hypothetical protein Taro_014132 [Colocasia esculenta]|uniref:Disease resistance R13L4/SHOC-2-like LRR domain-containing protein n=1 Tax=Colocasia esculenta TaxID=4460 RepID=A0A843UI51_COLES|nr:hypothetical protein [Colocasia esculenta]
MDHILTTFFSWMPFLRVLDLSGTKIRVLPEEIGLLTELRYFNLSDTLLSELPTYIGRLVNLGQLDLSDTGQLETIPRTTALCASLEKLDLSNSVHRWPEESDEHREEGRISLKDLGLLPKLNDLRLCEISAWSNSLPRTISYLTMQHIEDLSQSLLEFNAMIRLRGLCVEVCSGLLELTFGSGEFCSLGVLSFSRLSITKIDIMETSLQSLKQLHILGCHALKDLTLVYQLPHLQSIELRDCFGLEVLISSAADDDSAIFPQMTRITLYALANLRCICHRPLLLPQMEYLEVYGCPMLMKLPLESRSACNIKQIVGAQGWWDMLQWDEDKTKIKFLPFFKDPWKKCKNKKRNKNKKRKGPELEKDQASITVEREREFFYIFRLRGKSKKVRWPQGCKQEGEGASKGRELPFNR